MTTEIFPAPGHTFEARFGEMAFHLRFDADGKTMQFISADAANFDDAQAVIYKAVAIRAGVFMVTWTEADKTTVTHIEDFENNTVRTNITQPDHTFLNLFGSWTRLA